MDRRRTSTPANLGHHRTIRGGRLAATSVRPAYRGGSREHARRANLDLGRGRLAHHEHPLDLYEVVRQTHSAIFDPSMVPGDTVAHQVGEVSRSVGGLLARRWPLCPNKPVRHHPVTGEVEPNWCRSLGCWSCIVPLAIQSSEALAAAKPTHWATITGLRAAWSGAVGIKATMDRLVRRVRIEQPSAAWCYQIEPNPSGVGAHAHMWLRNVDVESGVLSSAAKSAGAGDHVAHGEAFERVDFYKRPAIAYPYKAILEHRPDDYDDWWPEATEYLALNGGRLEHKSKHFWLDSTGVPCDKASAVRAARSRTCRTRGGAR